MGITNLGKAAVSGLTLNVDAQTAFSYLAWGTGTTAFTAADTTLVTEGARAAATCTRVTTTVANDTAQLTYQFPITGTNTITEVGIFNAAVAGVMLARTVLTTPRSVINGDTYSLTYKVAFA